MPSTGDRVDPILAFRFVVAFDDLDAGGFSECSGLSLETEVMDYIEGGVNTHVHKFVTRTKQSNLTLRRGIARRVLWDWYWDITRGLFRSRNGSLRVLDTDGAKVVMEFQFFKAFPLKWAGPDLNASQSSVAVETLDICHQGLERRK